MHFFCSELILLTLITQINTTFVNVRGAFICFILCDTILSSKVCFDSMVLVLLSVDRPDFLFLQKPCEDYPVSHLLWIFNANKKATPNFFIEYYQRKIIEQSKGEMCSYKELLCYAYTIMSFLWLLYILKMFLLFVFGKLIIVLLESSLCFETAVKQFKTS